MSQAKGKTVGKKRGRGLSESANENVEEMEVDPQLSSGSPNSLTPTFRQVQFDYWNQPEEDESGSPAVKKKLTFDITRQAKIIAELQLGTNIKDCIQFRVTLKHAIDDKGIKRLKFHGIDKSGEVSFVAWREEADRLNDLIEVNKMYSLEGYSVKEDSKEFPSGSGNPLEIVVNRNSAIKEINDNQLPEIPFSFSSIDSLLGKEIKSRMDVIGVLVQDWGLKETSSKGMTRAISLTDKSMKTVFVTLWNWRAEKFSGEMKDVIALRKAVVSEFNLNRTLSTASDTLVWVNPIMQETDDLTSWFQEEENKRKNN